MTQDSSSIRKAKLNLPASGKNELLHIWINSFFVVKNVTKYQDFLSSAAKTTRCLSPVFVCSSSCQSVVGICLGNWQCRKSTLCLHADYLRLNHFFVKGQKYNKNIQIPEKQCSCLSPTSYNLNYVVLLPPNGCLVNFSFVIWGLAVDFLRWLSAVQKLRAPGCLSFDHHQKRGLGGILFCKLLGLFFNRKIKWPCRILVCPDNRNLICFPLSSES